jgi:hypothetical protein
MRQTLAVDLTFPGWARLDDDIAVLWNKPGGQATVRAEITETTLQAVPGILDPGQDGYDDTGTGQPVPMGHLDNAPRSGRVPHPLNPAWGR